MMIISKRVVIVVIIKQFYTLLRNFIFFREENDFSMFCGKLDGLAILTVSDL